MTAKAGERNVAGLPLGGSTGEVLTKSSDDDLDTEWGAGGGGGGGVANPLTENLEAAGFEITGMLEVNLLGDDGPPQTNIAMGVDPVARSAILRVVGQNAASGNLIAASNGSADGTSATMDGQGTLSLFTTTGVKGIDAWDGQGNVLRFALLPAGQIMTGVVTAPADGDLAASQVALWFDDTDGAAKLRIKGKSANGTVVTGNVVLS